jgi:hypothetical protein
MLELSPVSQLSAPPGQIVNIVFLLTNLGPQRSFLIDVDERQGEIFQENVVRVFNDII